MAYPYLIQGNTITVVIGSTPHTFTKSHIAFEKIKDAIREGDWETVQNIIEPKKVILNYGKGNISIQGEKLFWKERELHNALSRRVVSMYTEGFPIEPMIAFMENLMENPSNRAVEELYGFLEKNNLPITPDGHFLAFKKVKADYTDCYTGTISNAVGQVVVMERNQVDDDSDRTCSHGLHVCSQEYLKHFSGDKTMICKVNPRDVVSIPKDYNNSKMRCCRYEVVAELGVNPEEAFDKTVQSGPVDTVTPNENPGFDYYG